MCHLDHLTAALLSGGGHGEADDLTIVIGIDAEIRVADGFLDNREGRRIEGADGEHLRLWRGDCRQLLKRGWRAVILDAQLLDQRGVSAPCANPGEVFL